MKCLKMETFYGPYFDPDYDTLMERIYPPRVCIDNDGCQFCTLVKVDSANKNGILLKMVQVLTDLDLVISRSYISSDGGWFMDVFHVTDQFGNKLTDENLMLYIQQALCSNREGGRTTEDSSKVSLRRDLRPSHVSMEHTALEMTVTDSPGVLSEISAVLTELGCHLKAAAIWTHNTRAAMIIYLEELIPEGSITDPCRLAHIQDQLENVIEAHNPVGERWTVRITSGSTTHTERRLHQMMAADRDYEVDSGCGCNDSDEVEIVKHRKDCWKTHATITTCKEKGYSVVNIKSRDRPKLLFDTVCTLTDMQYVVFHAAVSSKCSIAIQEYFIRHRDGCILDSEHERHKVIQCLVAAIERRVSHGLRLELSTSNRVGLLSDVTRVFREHGLSISRAELGTQGERATGSFYVKDASGQELRPNLIESLRQEIGGNVHGKLFDWPQPSPSGASKSNNRGAEDRPRYSLGSLLWSHLERLSSNFGPIKL